MNHREERLQIRRRSCRKRAVGTRARLRYSQALSCAREASVLNDFTEGPKPTKFHFTHKD
jgi:hypothetical protein